MVFFVRVFGLDFSFEFGLEKIFFYLNYDFFNGYINIFNKVIVYFIKFDLIYNLESKLG